MNFPSTAQLLVFLHQHPILLAALIVVLLAIAANELYGRLTAGPRLSTSDAVRLMNDRSALVVDIRSAAEFKKGHLMGAINIPSPNLKERAAAQLSKDKTRPVIVYCNLGGNSLEAAKTLRRLGHTEVYPLRGGINNWTNSSLPVTVK